LTFIFLYKIPPDNDDLTDILAIDQMQAYIVYMGDKPKNEVPLSPLHLNMIQDVVDSSNIEDIEHEALLLHSYKRSFNGFAAMLTEQEAQKMAGTAYMLKPTLATFSFSNYYYS
jgi:hypothetical protein